MRLTIKGFVGKENKMGILVDLWRFLMHRKKWWLIPVIIVLLLIGGLIILSSSSALAPFIYTLF